MLIRLPLGRGSPRFFGEFTFSGSIPEAVDLLLGNKQFTFDVDGPKHPLLPPAIPGWAGFADSRQPQNELHAAAVRSALDFCYIFHSVLV